MIMKCLLPPKSATTAWPSSYSRILWLEETHVLLLKTTVIAAYHYHPITILWHPPVEVPVDDRLGEIVQVLHALGHVNGNDELGLQVDKPVH